MPVKKILPAVQRTAGRSLFRGSGSYHQSSERIEIERGLQREVDGVADHARELAHLLVDIARRDKKRALAPLAKLRRNFRACVLQNIRRERCRLCRLPAPALAFAAPAVEPPPSPCLADRVAAQHFHFAQLQP